MGGHSLLALQIITRIKEELGFKLSLKEFLENPTINKLNSLIVVENQIFEPKETLPAEIDTSNFPLSLIQKRIWIISKLDGLNPAYNIPFAYRLTGAINIDLFSEAINVLFKRHFIMFSLFKEKEGIPYCEINPVPVMVELNDFFDGQSERSEKNILSFIVRDSRKQFNLETGPLYRLYLSKQNDSTYFFHGTIHHIIFDGWSFSVFINDLIKIYDSLTLNTGLKLEDVKSYYLNYARTLEANERELDNSKSKKFWLENLKGCTPKLNFPYDFPRKDIASGLGEKELFRLSPEITSKLKKFAREKQATPFAALLSLIGVLFHKYCGENDICIGTHVANRNQSNLEKIVGMFVNTLPVRIKIDEHKNVSNLLDYTKNILLESLEHMEYPFEKIVEVVNPERFANINPIFQVAVQWIAYSSKPLIMNGIRGEKVDLNEGVSPFDITLNLWENRNFFEGEIEYNVDILNRETIIRLRNNFLHLVKVAVENPDLEISQIPVISENDRKRLEEFNKTESVIPACLAQDFFEKQSLIQPFKTAVVSGSSVLTYQALDEKANQVARHLISLGVTGGDLVGICLERSVEMVVSVLGVLKAGCCYLPLDPIFPDDRIKYMIEDSGAKVLISQSSLGNKLLHLNQKPVVLIDKDKKLISRHSKEKPELSIDNQALAYVIYTSGSTGKPKGVKVHHQAVVNFLSSMIKKPGITGDDRLLGVTTLSFDISVLELLLPLSAGAELVIAGIDDIIDGNRLSDLLTKNDITIMQATPATWTLLLGSGWKGKPNLKVLCGGEAISPGLVRELLPKVSTFWNMYGPTETTVWSTCNQLTNAEPPILIGTPIDNTTIHILDRNFKEVPVGVVGEVCIGGLGVTKGYHNRPELTAEKFITSENGRIIYRTGDLGRILSDGNIELFGRSDNQIKLRGFRIEPGEIESLLSRLSGVKEAVVKVHRFEDNDDRLVAFLAVDGMAKITKESIIESLSHNLPQYMIPSYFQEYDDFPRLPNGKANKKALVFNEKVLIAKASKEADIFTPTEEIIYKIWSETLKIKDISATDNFFDVGGNSLMAISLFSKIESAFKVKLNLRVFFDSPRIRSLAEIIELTMDKSAIRKSPTQNEDAKTKIINGEI
jgi:polyketide synthase PksJ